MHTAIRAICSTISTVDTAKYRCRPQRLPRKAEYTAENASAGRKNNSTVALSGEVNVDRSGM